MIAAQTGIVHPVKTLLKNQNQRPTHANIVAFLIVFNYVSVMLSFLYTFFYFFTFLKQQK